MGANSKLWAKFKNKEFNHGDASKTLNENKMISIILSELEEELVGNKTSSRFKKEIIHEARNV
ncbi:MAG: hypothetical protein QXO37_07640 [Candidatus Nitrosocaldaceae archaeon]